MKTRVFIFDEYDDDVAKEKPVKPKSDDEDNDRSAFEVNQFEDQ